MISSEGDFWPKIKEFLGFLVLASWATLLLAELLPLGINIVGNTLILGFTMAVFLCLGYIVMAGILGAVLRVTLRMQTFGRIGEFIIGAVAGALVLVLFNEVTPESLTITGIGPAIIGGVIGSLFVVMLGTAFGQLSWNQGEAWPSFVPRKSPPAASPVRRKVRGAGSEPELVEPGAVHNLRKAAVNSRDPADTRTFEATFQKPVRVRLEHDGKVVYEQTLSGSVKVFIGDYAAATGTTVLYVDGEPFGEWSYN